MSYSNRIKNLDSILVGQGVVRVASATSFIDLTTEQLNQENSIGYVADIQFKAKKQTKQKKSVLSPNPIDIWTRIESITLSCSPVEVTTYNVARALGQNTITEVTGNLEGEFGLGGGEDNQFWRVEVGIEFPTSDKKMLVILPKTKVTSDFDIPFIDDKGFEHTVVFEAIDATQGSLKHSNWNNKPLGIWKFS